MTRVGKYEYDVALSFAGEDREYVGWQQVHSSLKEQEKDGGPVDVARMQTLAMNIDKAKHRVPEAIKQAYSTWSPSLRRTKHKRSRSR